MRKLVVLLGVLVGAAFWAVPAFATDPATGYIEVCKVAGTGIPAGEQFQFNIPDAVDAAQATVVVRAGECSGAIAVAGTAGADGTFDTAVTETMAAHYKISAINVTTNYNGGSTSVPVTTTMFPVLAGGTVAQETRVDFTNVLVTGFIEVCKSPAPNSGLTSGEFSFKIEAGKNPVTGEFVSTQSISVPLNQCSSPIQVPAGATTVTETGGGVFITSVTVSGGGNDSPATVTDNGVTVNVAASDTAGTETLVRFFDALSTLKICKIGGTNDLGTFTGNVSFTIGGAGSATSATVAAGTAAAPRCVEVGPVMPGATISITEAATVGAMVSAVDLNGGTAGLTTNLGLGTVSFSALNGANVVTYTDVLAAPVPVKICKAGAAAGSTIPLSLNGVAGQGFRGTATTTTASITVPSTGGTACTDLLGPFAYGSTLAVTETPPADTALASAAVTGNAGSTATVSGSTASITVGAYGSTDMLAILTLTNGPAPAAPAAPPPAPTQTAPVSSSSSSGSNASSSSSSSSSNSSSGSNAGSSSTGGSSSLTQTPSIVKSRLHVALAMAKFVVVKHGALKGRWLGIRLTGNARTAKVKILLVGKQGKVIGHAIRTVKTGKFVRVMKIGAAVRSVKVSPLSL